MKLLRFIQFGQVNKQFRTITHFGKSYLQDHKSAPNVRKLTLLNTKFCLLPHQRSTTTSRGTTRFIYKTVHIPLFLRLNSYRSALKIVAIFVCNRQCTHCWKQDGARTTATILKNVELQQQHAVLKFDVNVYWQDDDKPWKIYGSFLLPFRSRKGNIAHLVTDKQALNQIFKKRLLVLWSMYAHVTIHTAAMLNREGQKRWVWSQRKSFLSVSARGLGWQTCCPRPTWPPHGPFIFLLTLTLSAGVFFLLKYL